MIVKTLRLKKLQKYYKCKTANKEYVLTLAYNVYNRHNMNNISEVSYPNKTRKRKMQRVNMNLQKD